MVDGKRWKADFLLLEQGTIEKQREKYMFRFVYIFIYKYMYTHLYRLVYTDTLPCFASWEDLESNDTTVAMSTFSTHVILQKKEPKAQWRNECFPDSRTGQGIYKIILLCQKGRKCYKMPHLKVYIKKTQESTETSFNVQNCNNLSNKIYKVVLDYNPKHNINICEAITYKKMRE